jgi:hypothetical protein
MDTRRAKQRAQRQPHNLPSHSVGVRGLRTSHTCSQDGQKNVSVLKPSRVRTLRRAAHIGQAGPLHGAMGATGICRADSSGDDTTTGRVHKTEN